MSAISIHFNRLNEYYDAIIKLSKVILRNYFIRSTTAGESIGFNFIVNMNNVYEDFITAMIEELVAQDSEFSDYVVEKQHRFDTLVEEEKIVTRPDVILRVKGLPRLTIPMIVDAKYKRESSNTDYYQVVAYSLAIPTARSCCLIYPQTENVVRDVLTLLRDPADPACRRVRLHAANINLDRDLEFRAYTAAIKSDLKVILRSCLQS
jgi:5-methylcytosine-specific restriction endonuclease McrBC regulatory subunit McrC